MILHGAIGPVQRNLRVVQMSVHNVAAEAPQRGRHQIFFDRFEQQLHRLFGAIVFYKERAKPVPHSGGIRRNFQRFPEGFLCVFGLARLG